MKKNNLLLMYFTLFFFLLLNYATLHAQETPTHNETNDGIVPVTLNNDVLIQKGRIFSTHIGLNAKFSKISIMDMDLTVNPWKQLLINAEVKGEMTYGHDGQQLAKGKFTLGIGYAVLNSEGQLIGIFGNFTRLRTDDEELNIHSSENIVGSKIVISLAQNEIEENMMISFGKALGARQLFIFNSFASFAYKNFKVEYEQNSDFLPQERSSLTITPMYQLKNNNYTLELGPYFELLKLKSPELNLDKSLKIIGITLRLGLKTNAGSFH